MALCLETNAVKKKKKRKHDSCSNKWVINVSVSCELVYIWVLSQEMCVSRLLGSRF